MITTNDIRDRSYIGRDAYAYHLIPICKYTNNKIKKIHMGMMCSNMIHCERCCDIWIIVNKIKKIHMSQHRSQKNDSTMNVIMVEVGDPGQPSPLVSSWVCHNFTTGVPWTQYVFDQTGAVSGTNG